MLSLWRLAEGKFTPEVRMGFVEARCPFLQTAAVRSDTRGDAYIK